MDLYERSRHELHQRLQEAIGPEAAGTLMAHLPSGGTRELATKGDIQRLELKVGGAEERLELKIDVTRQELRAEMQQMGRSLMVSFVTVIAIMNGILFAALQLAR